MVLLLVVGLFAVHGWDCGPDACKEDECNGGVLGSVDHWYPKGFMSK